MVKIGNPPNYFVQVFAIDWPWGEPGGDKVIAFYASTPGFAEVRDDLEALCDVAGNIHSAARGDDLLDQPVIQFMDNDVVSSPWLLPIDASSIGRGPQA